MSRLSPLILFLVAAAAATAADYGHLPQQPISAAGYTYESPVSIDVGGGRHPDVELHEARVQLPLLCLPGPSIESSAELDLFWTRLEFSGIRWKDLDLYQLQVPLDLILKQEPWQWWVNVTPGLFSDLDKVSSKDYRTLVHAAALRRTGPRMQWGLGVGYDRKFGEDQLYPVGGLIWDNGWDLRLQALLPDIRLEWVPRRTTLLYFQAEPAGGVWHVSEENQEYDLKIEGIRLLAGCEIHIAPHVWLRAGTGLSTLRHYEVRAPDGVKVGTDADETWTVHAAVLLR